MDSEPLLNIADYARAARRTLAKEVFDYYKGGRWMSSPFARTVPAGKN